MNGTISFDPASISRLPLDRLLVQAIQAPGFPKLGISRTLDWGTGFAKADGTFSLKSIIGRARLRVGAPAGWIVKAIVQDGRDLDDWIELGSGETISGVRVVLTDRAASVSGQVMDDKGVAASKGTVIVFPDNRSKWYENSRWVRTARPDQRGRFQIQGCPAGPYLIVAVDGVENGMWNDPEYLESLRQLAKPFTLEEGDSRTVTVTIAP
jgi:hypothetical protein